MFAFLASLFGDAAFAVAVAKGFKPSVIADHQTLGSFTMWAFVALTVVRGAATRWRIAFAGPRGWGMWALGVAGAALILVTAYYGGNLVYGIGVNVGPVKP